MWVLGTLKKCHAEQKVATKPVKFVVDLKQGGSTNVRRVR